MMTERIVRLDDVTPITWGGQEAARFLLSSRDTGGLFSYYEVSVPAGEGSIYHVHQEMDETFLVTTGEFEIKIGETIHHAPAGTLVFGPRGVPHSFYNTGPGTGRMLCTATPGGIETFFRELSELLTAGPPPEWEDMRELAARHRITAYQPQGGPHGGPPRDA
jgi:mannose-6-phosphate isomerase-like protein (cupin superfamily)